MPRSSRQARHCESLFIASVPSSSWLPSEVMMHALYSSSCKKRRRSRGQEGGGSRRERKNRKAHRQSVQVTALAHVAHVMHQRYIAAVAGHDEIVLRRPQLSILLRKPVGLVGACLRPHARTGRAGPQLTAGK